MYDFHTHTFLSDGVLSPIELIRRAVHIGYEVMAITDHVGPGNLEFILNALKKDCELAEKHWDIQVMPGVEITHTPKADIDRLAKEARRLGAGIVNVHGETISEPVEPGTNMAAVSSNNVDILAHPGLIQGKRRPSQLRTEFSWKYLAGKGTDLQMVMLSKLPPWQEPN